MTASLLGWQACAILLLSHLDRERIRTALAEMLIAVSIGFLPDELRTIIKSSQPEEEQRQLFVRALQTGQSDSPDVARRRKTKGRGVGVHTLASLFVVFFESLT